MVQSKGVILKQMNCSFKVQVIHEAFSPELNLQMEKVFAAINLFLKRIAQEYIPFKNFGAGANQPQVQPPLPKFLSQAPQLKKIYDYQTQLIHAGNDFSNDATKTTNLIKSWALEQAFFTYLQPLIDAKKIRAASLSMPNNYQVGALEEEDFSWTIAIEEPFQKKILANYNLKNGALSTAQTANPENLRLTTIVGEKISQVNRWAALGIMTDDLAWLHCLEKNQLTGFSLRSELMPFENGSLIYEEAAIFN